jgi:beta-lactamase class A
LGIRLATAAWPAAMLVVAVLAGPGGSNCSYLPVIDAPAPPAVAATPNPHPTFDQLEREITDLIEQAGATGGVTLVELGGVQAQRWSTNGDTQFAAASTYKLPLLMEEAQLLAAGKERESQLICYQSEDWEDGWYKDYEAGACYTRGQLIRRVGLQSDNTAAHMLVRDEGWTDALNRYAGRHGAKTSAFYYPNLTTSNDLAGLWVDEASGNAGGTRAQARLYPLLTHTSYEDGIPAGVPAAATVVHKIGSLDGEVNDAALVLGAPQGPYVLTICTQGPGAEEGWKLVADISRAIWEFESTR